MQNLYGDDWDESLEPDTAKRPSLSGSAGMSFVKSKTVMGDDLDGSEKAAKVKFAEPVAPSTKRKPAEGDFGKKTKQAVKEVQLEKKLEEKYGGKALKMLEKMGGYKLGQGVGKNNQGILNPIETMAVVDKGGVGHFKSEKVKKKDDIDMDIHDQEAQ
jgi:hypothetical protein